MQAIAQANKKHAFRITVLNTDGKPQIGMIMKIGNSATEYTSDEQGLIEFEHEINPKNIRTANFYFPEDKKKAARTLRLDETANDTIIRIDSQDDLIKYKQSGKTFPVSGILKNEGKPVVHAEIIIQGTGRNAFSDAEGKFSIEADYNHTIMIRAEKMENCYLDVNKFLQNPDEPYLINMIRKGADRIYSNVEQMPEYPGGMKAFFQYIRRKARTAELAEQTQKEGAVIVQFVVEKDGSITSPHIARSVDARLDTAALEAIIVMRDWIPAKDHGITVRCKYSVPVPFKLPEPQKTEKQSETVISVPEPDDSLHTDSLANDSIVKKMPEPVLDISANDTLKNDSTAGNPLPTDFVQTIQEKNSRIQQADSLPADSTLQAPSQPATEIKPKKRNFFVRFFRWLFGIKDKEKESISPSAINEPEKSIEKETSDK